MRDATLEREIGPEIDDLLLHLKGLVLVRKLLEQRGATAAELDEHGAEIERLRERLANLIRGGGGVQEGAAA
jgi:hypothetical protein